jgi:hypothetical protein
MLTATTDMRQSEVTPKTKAGVCDPGIPTTAGLKQATYNAGPTEARADRPGVAPKIGVLEPCPTTHNPNDASPGCF